MHFHAALNGNPVQTFGTGYIVLRSLVTLANLYGSCCTVLISHALRPQAAKFTSYQKECVHAYANGARQDCEMEDARDPLLPN